VWTRGTTLSKKVKGILYSRIFYTVAIMDTFKTEWFLHPEWWFSKSVEYDEYITVKYGHLLDGLDGLDGLGALDTDPLTLILIYDQLPRHVYRNAYGNHVIEYYLEKAIDIVLSLHNNEGYVRSLTAIEWTFFMLPLRHTKNSIVICKYVIKKTWERMRACAVSCDVDVYRRFLKASYSNLNTEDQSGFVRRGILLETKRVKKAWNVLDFAPPIKGIGVDVKASHPICAMLDLSVIDFERPILISLSGGVDSMVCSHLIKHHAPCATVVAVHINYTNRPQCADEVEVLKYWCKVVGIPLYVRNIDEINRGPCMEHELRDLYETYTRNVRYGTYKTVARSEVAGSGVPQVILGHNYDDCLENIMTNIASKNKYDNLWGMSYSVLQDGIEFVRPLLKVPKDMIYAYAHEHNIPYLPNSTPIWSQRGQIRNDIVPALDKWNGQFVEGLYTLCDVTRQLHEVMRASVRDWLSGGDALPFVRTIHSVDGLSESALFWREVFLVLCGTAPSSKSLDNVLEFIRRVKAARAAKAVKAQVVDKRTMVMKNVMLEVKMSVGGVVCVKITS
jgi:tRNA(Ile)-lysidine synthetase-like protein